MKRIAFICFVLGTLPFLIKAQTKYGHLNFNNIVALMPESKKADETLKGYRDQLVAEGQKMAEELKKSVDNFYKEVNAGTMAPAAQAKEEEALNKQQQKIIEYEQEVAQKVQIRREELLQPIVEKLENTVKEIAEADGFRMIFDTSLFNAILYAESSVDIADKVKAKLGL